MGYDSSRQPGAGGVVVGIGLAVAVLLLVVLAGGLAAFMFMKQASAREQALLQEQRARVEAERAIVAEKQAKEALAEAKAAQQQTSKKTEQTVTARKISITIDQEGSISLEGKTAHDSDFGYVPAQSQER